MTIALRMLYSCLELGGFRTLVGFVICSNCVPGLQSEGFISGVLNSRRALLSGYMQASSQISQTLQHARSASSAPEPVELPRVLLVVQTRGCLPFSCIDAQHD